MHLITRPSNIRSGIPSLLSSFFDDDWFVSDSHWLSRIPAANIKEQDRELTIRFFQESGKPDILLLVYYFWQ